MDSKGDREGDRNILRYVLFIPAFSPEIYAFLMEQLPIYEQIVEHLFPALTNGKPTFSCEDFLRRGQLAEHSWFS